MHNKGEDEKQSQGQAQRIRVESAYDRALPNRSRRMRIGVRLSGIGVLLRFTFEVLGFRRALLTQEDHEQHVRAQLKELTLPVLEQRRAEVSGAEIIEQAQWGQTING